ncbi:transferase [Streptomyces sp. NPDC058653]|uniref:transferase n=1 Tax=Streptomyces sp. NPDC058653 TaxID=3346576 RepID=UPI0036479AC0
MNAFVAHCTADAAGTVTFEPARAKDTVGGELVLRRRGGSAPADEVRLPLTGPRAVLDPAVPLAEGRWDIVHAAEPGDPDGRPVRPGTRDVRALVDRVPGAGPVTVRVPYPTADGRLALRSWVRAPHAEAGAIHLGGGAMTVRGVLYGAEAGDGARVEARRKATRDGGGEGATAPRTHGVPLTGGADGGFTFTLPYEALAEPAMTGRQLWELWLMPAHGADPVRLSRILDDVWDRKNVHVYPAYGADGWLAAPCYSGDNNLHVRLDPRS